MVRVGSDEDVVLVEELWLRVFVEFPLREGEGYSLDFSKRTCCGIQSEESKEPSTLRFSFSRFVTFPIELA